MLHIFDGNNELRVRFEADPTGFATRNLYNLIEGMSDPVIVVFDGFNCNARRRKKYPQYKGNRKDAGEDVYASIDLFKKVVKHSHAITIEVPTYEADDVIAQIAREYATEMPVRIYSTDGDFQQLRTSPNVETTRHTYHNVEPKYVRLYKTLVGDPRDNIKGVIGFGDKSWEACNKEALNKIFESRFGVFNPEEIGVKPKLADWMSKNFAHLLDLWDIVGFIPVPDSLVSTNTHVGVPNRDEAYRMLTQFFQ